MIITMVVGWLVGLMAFNASYSSNIFQKRSCLVSEQYLITINILFGPSAVIPPKDLDGDE
jgi:hypothetical protein